MVVEEDMKMLIDRNAQVKEHRTVYPPIEISRARGSVYRPETIDHRDVLEGRVSRPDDQFYDFDYYGYCWKRKK
jgi:hypothetical protein